LHLKCENLQKTGSFKPRGVLNKISQLSDDERAAGVVTISAGNHAQALAWAATRLGVTATVVMPAGTSRTKADASRAYGAEVVIHGTVFEAFEKARELERDRGLTFIHPFDDPHIIAGAAGVGLEIVEQLDDVDTIVVPIGGGGLIAGVAAAVKLSKPDVRVFGVEPEGAAAMRASVDAGRPMQLDAVSTIADGLAPPMAGELNYEYVERYVDDVVLVSDDEIRAAMEPLYTRARLVVELSGAAALAALLAGRIPITPSDQVVAVLSGGNVDASRLAPLWNDRT
ncbi:MAG: threonine/serine dehydratase, partial [Gemmatimonadales bacterium]